MNELSFILAVLVHKEILTKGEAYKVQRAHSEGVINGDLKQMITKVENAFATKDELLEKVDASTLLK